jgi:hypothetical protein
VTSLSESRSELDAMIADIELTLVSIIQGVALTVLIETLDCASARGMAGKKPRQWDFRLADEDDPGTRPRRLH